MSNSLVEKLTGNIFIEIDMDLRRLSTTLGIKL